MVNLQDIRGERKKRLFYTSPPGVTQIFVMRATEAIDETTKDFDIVDSVRFSQLLGETNSKIFSGCLSDSSFLSTLDYLISSLQKSISGRSKPVKIIMSGAGTSGRIAFVCARGWNEVSEEKKKIYYFSLKINNFYFLLLFLLFSVYLLLFLFSFSSFSAFSFIFLLSSVIFIFFYFLDFLSSFRSLIFFELFLFFFPLPFLSFGLFTFSFLFSESSFSFFLCFCFCFLLSFLFSPF